MVFFLAAAAAAVGEAKGTRIEAGRTAIRVPATLVRRAAAGIVVAVLLLLLLLLLLYFLLLSLLPATPSVSNFFPILVLLLLLRGGSSHILAVSLLFNVECRVCESNQDGFSGN